MGWLSALGVSRTGICGAITGLALATTPHPVFAQTGSIAGVVTTTEAAAAPIRVTIDPGVCGQTLPNERIVVDAAGHLANVVIALPDLKAEAPAEVLVSNDSCRFVPHVSLLRPNGTVKMTSNDPLLHTMHAAAPDGRAMFNVSIPIPKMVLSRPVDKTGPVALSCSTHTWMRGYLYVTDAKAVLSGADGSFRIDGVPAGTHQLIVWHESLKAASPLTVTVKAGETTTVPIAMR